MPEEPFRTGRLLLDSVSSADVAAAEPGVPVLFSVLVVVFVLLFLLTVRNFLQVLPFIADSFLRARGSVALENSVKVSRDRNLVAIVLTIPAVLLMSRFGMYEPSFIAGMGSNVKLSLVASMFLGFLLVRYLLYRAFFPRKRYDNYQLSYRSGFTYFILLMLLVLVSAGILWLFNVNDLFMRNFIIAEAAAVYLIFLVRRAQILSLSCSVLTTFLYLCALELLPAGLWISVAVFL